MIFLTGETTGAKMVEILSAANWGRMFVEKKPSPYSGELWGFDNGAYGWWVRGEPFNEELYLKRLYRAYEVGIPYFAVIPDMVGQGDDSLAYSLGWMDRLPTDWPWYLAIQDGMSEDLVLNVLDKVDGIFLGGTNAFKAMAYYWCEIAHENGKKFHYGRAGTAQKIRDALLIGVDSADSAFPLWTKDRLHETIGWVRGENIQRSLFAPKDCFVTTAK